MFVLFLEHRPLLVSRLFHMLQGVSQDGQLTAVLAGVVTLYNGEVQRRRNVSLATRPNMKNTSVNIDRADKVHAASSNSVIKTKP